MWIANIEDRIADDFLGDPKFAFLRQLAGQPVSRFEHETSAFLVKLSQTGDIDRGDTGDFPTLYGERWIACATRNGDPLALYEFFAGMADPYEPATPGARLIGAAITVDAAHVGEGIGGAMLKSLYQAGVLIVPSGHMTTAGARLFNSLATAGVSVPSPGQITCPWPR